MGALHYTMIIEWNDRDNIFVVTIPEFSGCETHSETYEEAVKNGKEVMELCIESEQALGRPIPPPRRYDAA